jgi:hypothetical protein
MFYDTKLEMLESSNLTVIKTIDADVQPFSKSIAFEDGYTLEITHRAFCDKDVQVELCRYVRVDDQIYIVLDSKEWSDYMELFLYRCKPDFA